MEPKYLPLQRIIYALNESQQQQQEKWQNWKIIYRKWGSVSLVSLMRLQPERDAIVSIFMFQKNYLKAKKKKKLKQTLAKCQLVHTLCTNKCPLNNITIWIYEKINICIISSRQLLSTQTVRYILPTTIYILFSISFFDVFVFIYFFFFLFYFKFSLNWMRCNSYFYSGLHINSRLWFSVLSSVVSCLISFVVHLRSDFCISFFFCVQTKTIHIFLFVFCCCCIFLMRWTWAWRAFELTNA